MAQNDNLINGIPGQEVDQAQLKDALHNIIKQAASGGAPALAMFSQLQKEREQRLDAAAKGLSKPLGKEHPEVLALQDEARSVAGLRSALDIQRARLKSWPKVRANEWAVFGTVTDAQGQPAAGLTVRVYDHDRKYDDLLGETETNANGDFSVVYHERDFKETNENLPELYVMVLDAKGTQLYSSREDIRFNAGRSEYFSIQLGQASPATRATPKPGDATIKINRKKG